MTNRKRRVHVAASLLTAALFTGTLATDAQAQFGVSKSPAPSPTASAPKGMDEVETRVSSMQDAIKAAVELFQRANGSTDEKLARLDKVLAAIDSSLVEIGDNGVLYKEIDKAIKASEALQTKYKDKTTDPKIEAKIRERYQKLADKIAVNINNLYENRLVLGKTRTDLEKRRNSLGQEKDFIVDLIAADEMSAANEALIDVIETVKGVVVSIDQFAENITAVPAAEETGKETR